MDRKTVGGQSGFGDRGPSKGAWLRFLLVASLLAGTGLFLRSRAQADILPPREPLSSFPLQIGDWQGTAITIPNWALDVLGAGEFVQRSYQRSADEAPVDLFIAYFPSQRMGSTMHSPQNCLPGSGWTPVEEARAGLVESGNPKVQVNRYVIAKGLDRMLVLYWFQEHGRVEASEYWSKFYLVADAIRINRSDGAMIRVMTPISHDETEASAETRGRAFVRVLLPLLDTYIPR